MRKVKADSFIQMKEYLEKIKLNRWGWSMKV